MRRLILLILFLLSSTACSTATLVKPEYVRQQVPPLPAAPEFYEVRFVLVDDNYCAQRLGVKIVQVSGTPPLYGLNEENAKNLIKDVLLLQAHDSELAGILE